MVQLRGITWDHVRGKNPLIAATEYFTSQYPDINISWDARSLKDFGDYPVEKLAEHYDLILLDHPFIGTGVQKKVIVALNEWVSEEFLEDQKENSVGDSYASYTWQGKQWALAVDAAAQVSAYRKDILKELGIDVPQSWDDVFSLAHSLPGKYKVGIPLCPTDSICSFISLCANIRKDFWDNDEGINPDVGLEAMNILQHLVPLVHPNSLEMNPIKILDHMSQNDDIVYVPLLFGYSNYSQPDFAPKLIHFTNIPSTHSQPVGSILGGVGLAISSYSKYKNEAAQFAMYVSSANCQKTLYFQNGGQPGHRAAWLDSKVNSESSDYFKNTLQTLDMSYLRPRYPSYNLFQEKSGEIIHSFIKEKGNNANELIKNINKIYKDLKKVSEWL